MAGLLTWLEQELELVDRVSSQSDSDPKERIIDRQSPVIVKKKIT